MDEFADFFAPASVRFERMLPGPIERVWDHLTKPDLLALWFVPLIIEPREGGAIEARFDLDPNDPGEPETGEVTCWAPPRRLSMQWGRSMSEVTFELFAEGEKVRLVLTEVKIPRVDLVAAGWHSYVSALSAIMSGEDPAPLKAKWRDWIGYYQARLGQSATKQD